MWMWPRFYDIELHYVNWDDLLMEGSNITSEFIAAYKKQNKTNSKAPTKTDR